MKLILRTLGIILLLFATVTLVIDGTKTLSKGQLCVTPFGEQWLLFNRDSLRAAKKAVEDQIHPLLWDPIIATLLLWPSWVILGGLGILFYWIGRKRYKINLYAN